MKPFLSVAVLAYNEAGTVETTVRRCSAALQSIDASHELVLVDDGSTDGTREIMTRVAGTLPSCRTIFHPRNLGIGAGIRTCYFGTTGRWATWLPADLQADPDELPRLVGLLEDCDVLVTYRDPAGRSIGRLRRLVSAGDRIMVGLLFGLWLRDLHWVRFFRRDVLDRMSLTCRSPFADTEMVVHARQHGARVREAPLDELERRYGEASGASPANVVAALGDLLALRLRGTRVAGDGVAPTLPAHLDTSWLDDGGPVT